MNHPVNAQLEAAYNVRAAIPSHPAVFADWRERSERARSFLPGLLDLAYGADPLERLDLFPAGADAPLHVFIHGGYWQAMDKADFSFLAEAWHARGVAFAVLNYGLCPTVTLDDIVAQMRRALPWLQAHAGELGLDPARFQVSGHSAGGHLAAMLLATDWSHRGGGLSMAPIHSAVSISGLFDLEPLRYTSMNEKVGMDAVVAQRNSPLGMRPAVDAPLLLAVGEHESADFHAQSDRLEQRWGAYLSQVRRMNLAACNHLQAVEELGRAGSELYRAATGMLANS